MTNLTLPITEKKWHEIYQKLASEHPPSVLLIRAKMRRVLGFTVRRHRNWCAVDGHYWQLYLDFFDEKSMTYFMLKYINV